jgi:SAM-dependent methyltransferase
MLNLDLIQTRDVDVCGDAEILPFASGSFTVILTQETLEHIRDPKSALAEMHRVLHERGVLYCQVPFIIGYHPGPTDFERWTREGIIELLRRAGFACEEVGISVGPATGCYRIAVEFWAVLLSCIWPGLYLPVKGLVALLLSPLKLLDPLMIRSSQADRIAGGYYVVARKICPKTHPSMS